MAVSDKIRRTTSQKHINKNELPWKLCYSVYVAVNFYCITMKQLSREIKTCSNNTVIK